MTQILLNNKIYTVEGDDAVLLREAVATLEKTATENSQKLDQATQQVTTLTAQKNDLEAKAGKAEGELAATKTKLDEATQQLQTKNDAADVDYDELIKERLELWSEVLPVIRQDNENYQPDYSYTPLQIKLDYIFKTCKDQETLKALQERKARLDEGDQGAIGFVEGVYLGLIKDTGKQKRATHTDSVLDSIMFGKHFSATHNDGSDESRETGNVTRIDHRANLQKRMDAKNPANRKNKAGNAS